MNEQSSICGKKCEVYSRVNGYYRPVSAWNLGKKEEFRDRKTYNPSKSMDGFRRHTA